MIRPRPAHWFELWVARDDVLMALDALARTSSAEFESDPAAGEPAERGRIDAALREFAQLAQRYRAYWPKPSAVCRDTQGAPAEVLERGLRGVRAWIADAEPVVGSLQAKQAELSQLAALGRLVEALGDTQLDLGAFARSGPNLQSILLALRADREAPPAPREAIVRTVITPGETFVLALGSAAALHELRHHAAAAEARVIALAPWLEAGRETNLERIERERERCAAEITALEARLEEIAARHALREALGDVVCAAWCCTRVGPVAREGVLVRVTGWTSSPARLREALDAGRARALIRIGAPPRGLQPPLLLRNPRWAQPFEVFARLLGMPARSGADPTLLLAFVVPLLFGYMFGDIGQGLLLAAAGFALRKRWPLARILVPCGLAAAAFGLLFGSVFSVEGWVTPRWVRPIEVPLEVLLVPVAGGAALLTAGLGLRALEAWWSGEWRGWIERDVGVLLVYWGLLAGTVAPTGFLIAAAGAAYAAAAALAASRGPRGALSALGRLAESTFQLLLNTLSFVRVGAFALAHAGLSAAVAALAEGTDAAWSRALLIVAGNAVIIAIEVLVVSVQTTRLVLFEFFVRFFVGQGREFRPVAAPTSHYGEALHEAGT